MQEMAAQEKTFGDRTESFAQRGNRNGRRVFVSGGTRGVSFVTSAFGMRLIFDEQGEAADAQRT